MSQQSINLGSGPNTGDGDQLRVGGAKINANFTELYLAVNNANLLAFSGLIGAADRFPYFTGVGALSLATIGAYSRQLLALADAASWRGAGGLGLGTVSTLNTGATGASLVQAATADSAQTAIGATALGKSLIMAASVDAAQTAIGATTVGKALILAASAAAGRTALALGTASTVNTGATGASLMAAANTDAAQTAMGATTVGKALMVATDQAAGRTALGLKTAAVADIVGTVSQSGGVPTGAIIERGATANGEYTKFADGTVDCWALLSGLTHTASTELVTTWTLPTSVLYITVITNLQMTVRAPSSTQAFTVEKLQASLSSATAVQVRSKFSASQDYSIFINLKGRWF